MRPLFAMFVFVISCASANAACCYFSAKNTDILQPAQKVFLSWDPVEKVEAFTVQPKFEGNALDFGMVIPTPTQPKLHEMPRDFFKHLAFYTILKKREFPQSKLQPHPRMELGGAQVLRRMNALADARLLAPGAPDRRNTPPGPLPYHPRFKRSSSKAVAWRL